MTAYNGQRGDQGKIVQSQGKMIEKLLIKIKKLKQAKLDGDFAIFNVDKEEQDQKRKQEFQNQFNLDLKTY